METWTGGGEVSGEKGPAGAASYLFVVFFNILRAERLVVSKRGGGEGGGGVRHREKQWRGKCV